MKGDNRATEEAKGYAEISPSQEKGRVIFTGENCKKEDLLSKNIQFLGKVKKFPI